MNAHDSITDLMAKAERAGQSARQLLAAGDADGACNRAYYAMFNAARAALVLSDAPEAARSARTHGGLIAAFGLHLVKPGHVPAELGRMLNRSRQVRLMADYTGDSIETGEAAQIVGNAQRFVSALQEIIHRGGAPVQEDHAEP